MLNLFFSRAADLKNVKADPGQLEQVLMNLTVNASRRDAARRQSHHRNPQRRLSIPPKPKCVPAWCPALMFCFPSPIPGMAWTKKRWRASSNHFSPPRKSAKAPVSASPRFTASSSKVAASSGWNRRPGREVASKFICHKCKSHAIPPSRSRWFFRALAEAQTILVVEDDASVRELAGRFLETAGFRVLAAKDGVEALQFATERGSEIGALLTDIVMPRMRGTELSARLSALIPDLKIIFMSGYLEQMEGHKPVDSFFLEKPFTREALLRTVNEAFRSADLAHLKR